MEFLTAIATTSFKNRVYCWVLMSRNILTICFLVGLFGLNLCVASAQNDPEVSQTDIKEFENHVKPFLTEYCSRCHGKRIQRADFAFHDVDGNVSNAKDWERWEKILEMISIGDMPPEDQTQPSKTKRLQITTWIAAELKKIGKGPDAVSLQLPSQGNRINHEELFSGKHQGPSFSRARLWRLSPEIYKEFTDKLFPQRTSQKTISQPFVDLGGKEIRDYTLLVADEGTINVLLQTSHLVAGKLICGEKQSAVKRKKARNEVDPIGPSYRPIKGYFRPAYLVFNRFAKRTENVAESEMDNVLETAFRYLLQRRPTSDEVQHYKNNLFRKTLKSGGRAEGLRYLLMGIMMSTEFVFRMEHGLGTRLTDGRRMLSPRELSYAISYAITDDVPDDQLRSAVAEGKLKTKQDVERQVRRLLSEPAGENYWGFVPRGNTTVGQLLRQPYGQLKNKRLLRFFRQYFGYHKSIDVFKDESRNNRHEPFRLVMDADLMVLHALKNDRHVLEELLTTDKYFVAYMPPAEVKRFMDRLKKNKGQDNKRKKKRNAYETEMLSKGLMPNPNKHYRRYVDSYNLPDDWSYPIKQPAALPQQMRSGILTHPAWLTSFSGNFENDPVRRGKWIQEKLLAGVVPDLPIGVDARVPVDHSRTLRERFEIVNEEKCWRCHKKMNPLGDVFESYDDFGRFRKFEPLGDVEEYSKKLSEYERLLRRAKGDANKVRMAKPELKRVAVDSSTVIKNAADPNLNGKYNNAAEMLQKFAKSPRVRQSFIRHVFRYFMGRNETLNDSPTLMAMDRTYVQSQGSFKETLITLLTSDSFLYRK